VSTYQKLVLVADVQAMGFYLVVIDPERICESEHPGGPITGRERQVQHWNEHDEDNANDNCGTEAQWHDDDERRR